MSDELKDPPRLLDAAAGAPAGLRDALGAAARDVGSAAQLSRLAGRLGPLLDAPVPPPPATTAAGLSGAAKLGLAALALLAAGGGAWLLSTSQSASPPAPIPASPAPAEVAAPAPLPSPSPSPVVASESAVAPAEPPASQVLPVKPAPAAQLSEAELLEQARSALKADPSRALARANEHRRRFPGGVLVQEREVIAISALRQLGRTAEAEQRAEAFSKAFPGSAFQRKLKPAP